MEAPNPNREVTRNTIRDALKAAGQEGFLFILEDLINDTVRNFLNCYILH